MHQVSKLSVIVIVFGALASISKDARTWQEELGIPDIIGRAQTLAILGTAYLLREVLCF